LSGEIYLQPIEKQYGKLGTHKRKVHRGTMKNRVGSQCVTVLMNATPHSTGSIDINNHESGGTIAGIEHCNTAHNWHPFNHSGPQRADALLPLIELFRDRGVRRCREIGARHGDTFHHVMCSLPKRSFGVAVDLGGGAWGTPTSVPHLRRAAEDLVRKGYRIDVILRDSNSHEVRAKVRECRPSDAVLIDGDHRYAGVSADWHFYGQLAPIVAFHYIA
jgi:hypothetical protein